MDDEQIALLEKLDLPSSFDHLDDKELIRIEDALANELQQHGINEARDGLNAHGELCRSVIVAIPD